MESGLTIPPVFLSLSARVLILLVSVEYGEGRGISNSTLNRSRGSNSKLVLCAELGV